jgi:hypothetical protein
MRTAYLLLLALSLAAQDFTQRGFLDFRLTGYPQKAQGDGGRAVAETLLRYEPGFRVSSQLRLDAAFDARIDSHRQVQRTWGLSWQDREIRRPAFAVRRLSATYHRGGLTAELGKQFIRWGKADVLNPTDRFAPRDFVNVVDEEILAVTAARVTCEAGAGDTVELVWVPRFTPSRTPLPDQRWVVLPDVLPKIPLVDTSARLPPGPQFGARWNHLGRGYENSLTFYQGYLHLPSIDGWLIHGSAPRMEFALYYPSVRMYGADAAVSLPWLTVKGEAGYFNSRAGDADDYLQYVVQLERQAGEWNLVGGYAGELVTSELYAVEFAPDRALARSFLGRASYTIGVDRSLAVEGAVRRNGDAVWLTFEYSQAVGRHLRATGSFTLIRGAPTDFIGQYRRNSNAVLSLRYSL